MTVRVGLFAVVACFALLLASPSPVKAEHKIADAALGSSLGTTSGHQTERSHQALLTAHAASSPALRGNAAKPALNSPARNSHIWVALIALGINGVLALGTLILAMFSIRQAKTLDKTLAETRKAADAAVAQAEATRNALEETRRAGQLTERSVEIAEQSLRVQRAYVYVIPTVETSTKNDVPKSVTCKIVNRGRTPAIITETALHARILEGSKHPPEMPSYKPNSTNILLEADPSGLGGGITSHPRLNLSDEQWSAIKQGESALIVYGYVRYCDIFGKHHRTGFGRRYSRRLSEQKGEPTLIFTGLPAYEYSEDEK